MEGDSLIYLILFVSIILLNGLAILAYKKFRTPLWLSGIIIGVFGPIISFAAMSLFMKEGSAYEGVGIAGAFIAIVIIINGLIILTIGIIQAIKSSSSEKKIN